MNLVEKLDNDFKEALKAKDAERLGLMRLVRSNIKNLEINKQASASDEDVVEILQREIKQHKETIEGLQKNNRQDEIVSQEKEIEILKLYLPEQISGSELKDVVNKAISEVEASSPSDMGKVMGKVMPQLKGRATGDEVGQMVKDLLSGTK